MLQLVKSSAWKVVAASLGAGEVIAPLLMGVQARPPFAPGQLGAVIAYALCAAGWLAFGAWTWRRLAHMRDGEGRDVYNGGVLGWGLPVGIAMTVANAVREAGDGGDVPSWRFAARALTHALISVPLFLWGGYLFGTAMRATLGPPRRG